MQECNERIAITQILKWIKDDEVFGDDMDPVENDYKQHCKIKLEIM